MSEREEMTNLEQIVWLRDLLSWTIDEIDLQKTARQELARQLFEAKEKLGGAK